MPKPDKREERLKPISFFERIQADFEQAELYHREYCAETAEIVSRRYREAGRKLEAHGAMQVALAIRRQLKRATAWRAKLKAEDHRRQQSARRKKS